jgi:hypothetical protein
VAAGQDDWDNDAAVLKASTDKKDVFMQSDVCHSFVQTASVRLKTDPSPDAPVLCEEFVLPPTLVARCDNQTLGKCFVQALERHMTGNFQQFLDLLNVALLFLFCSDTASANLLCKNQLQALLLHCLAGASAGIYFFFEACCLHKLCRVSTFTLKSQGVMTPMYSLGRLQRLRSHKSQMHNAVEKLVETMTVHRQSPPPDPDSQNKAAFLSLLQGASTVHYANTFGQAGEDGSDSDDDKPGIVQSVENLFIFFWGLLSSKVLVHYCVGPACCKSKKHSQKRASSRVYKLPKQVCVCVYVCVCMCMCVCMCCCFHSCFYNCFHYCFRCCFHYCFHCCFHFSRNPEIQKIQKSRNRQIPKSQNQ